MEKEKTEREDRLEAVIWDSFKVLESHGVNIMRYRLDALPKAIEEAFPKPARDLLLDYLDKYTEALKKSLEEKPASRGGGERRLMEDIRSLISKYEEDEAFGTFVKPPALMLESALDQFFELWKPEGKGRE